MPLNPLGPIQNAKGVTLDVNPGTFPNVYETLAQWFQPITFGVVTKSVVNFQVSESVVDTAFFGVWQPMKPQELRMKPEGQRSWKWFTLYAQPTVTLSPDMILLRGGVQYRVMGVTDYTQYGYLKYDLASDYSGSGPGSY